MNEHLETILRYIEPAKLLELIFQITQFVLVLIATMVMLRVIKTAIDRIGHGMRNRSKTIEDQKRVDTLTRVLKYVASLVLILLGTLIALGTIGISIAPVLAAAGVVGLAVGFGAQSLVKDYFMGIVLLIENQIRAGDVIEVSGKSGTVENMTLRYVRLRDAEGNVHFIPNGQINSVTNSTMDFAYALIDLSISYKENIDTCIEVMQQVGQKLAQHSEWQDRITEPMTTFGVQKLADTAVIVRVRFKTVAGEQWAVRREYNKQIKAEFDKMGIELSMPHANTNLNDTALNKLTARI